ncbi:MAG: sigma 54-interacting transcriptional regulator [Planctomycetes bacterium]|nr:sigma 54-interacting transcriptional regulator [Planctomycetota bacterium]MCB9886685.1 sigma 54-interacting transcriptional regulator [Planctomycetota bacterium]
MNVDSLPQVMVAVAQSLALPEVLRAIVGGIADCRHVALTRIWLFGPGDLCASCRFAEECVDRSRCLHLVASAGNVDGATFDAGNLHGAFRRFPIGVRKIGKVAASGEPMLLADVRGDEDWIADKPWFAAQGVRAFAAQPLIFRGEVLGVLALFDRRPLDDVQLRWLRVFADHAAVGIANARAFEEIDRLRARLQSENQYLHEEVERAHGAADVVADSDAMRRVLQQVRIVAPTDATVLVTGESGTGKEVVARAIHDNSSRRDRPLVRVNCGAVPENLFESEFFGHVRGSFTGAIKDRVGRFELADGGTLFLDEVGEIPLSMQPKLLRILQEREFERVGDGRTRKVDVRIVAATNRDLRAEVDAGRFRQDLYYRLSVFPVELPPLRERRGDIAALAEHFLRAVAAQRGGKVPRLSQAVLQQLERHDWPGNVRELQNAIERALILAPHGPLRFDTLGGQGRRPVAPPSPQSMPVRTRADLLVDERQNLTAALRATRGKVFGPGGAAELLGMKPTTVASRIARLGIDRKNP